MDKSISRRQLLEMTAGMAAASALGFRFATAGEDGLLKNPGFETGELGPWKVAAGSARVVMDQPQEGQWSLALGPQPAIVQQIVAVQPSSTYRLSGWLKSGSGAEEVRLGIKDYGGAEQVVPVARVAYTEASVEFTTGAGVHRAMVFLSHPGGDREAHADGLKLEYLGEAKTTGQEGVANSIIVLPARVPVTDLGIPQQSNDKLAWLLDAKFGMFIHWGLYAGPAKGEWYMHAAQISPEKYRKYAFPESGEEYFSADGYDPGHWAEVARAAGMKWMCLTARHHDGFCLFDSPHPNAFTSVQTLGRDLFADYVKACRRERLKVGVYYSPLSWRYPGYYDVTGTDCKPNVFGYRTDASHKENARLMKEENYANVRKLMSSYGPIDHIFWDGGWLAEQGSDRDSVFFHDPGDYMDPANPWPVGEQYLEYGPNKRPLGIMGLVRKHQPNVIANPRYGWIGDLREIEGGPPVTGPVRSAELFDKCLSLHGGGWGYNAQAIQAGQVMSRDSIIEHLVNCVIRNMVLLANFGPDRHGQMPPLVEQRLREVGAWLEKAGPAIYGTRGGPWHPADGQYGFCYKGKTLYTHILKGYAGNTFSTPPVGPLRPTRVYDVLSNQPLTFALQADRTIAVSGLNRDRSPADSIFAIEFDRDVMAYATRKG